MNANIGVDDLVDLMKDLGIEETQRVSTLIAALEQDENGDEDEEFEE